MPQKYVECQMCGAVLTPEDLFCGECGEPVPGAAEATAPEAEALPEPAAPREPGPREPESPSAVEIPPSPVERRLDQGEVPVAAPQPPAGRKGWTIAASVVAIAGTVLCLLGVGLWALVAFTPPAEDMTEAENFTVATVCCGLPLVGPAMVLVVVAAVIWYVRVRNGR